MIFVCGLYRLIHLSSMYVFAFNSNCTLERLFFRKFYKSFSVTIPNDDDFLKATVDRRLFWQSPGFLCHVGFTYLGHFFLIGRQDDKIS